MIIKKSPNKFALLQSHTPKFFEVLIYFGFTHSTIDPSFFAYIMNLVLFSCFFMWMTLFSHVQIHILWDWLKLFHTNISKLKTSTAWNNFGYCFGNNLMIWDIAQWYNLMTSQVDNFFKEMTDLRGNCSRNNIMI